MEAEGEDVHGEANFVDPIDGAVVLDAGCGMGRVAVELARRGRRVVGVDNDGDMLAYARQKPEPVRWERADLASMELGERFDIIVMAGNILTFVQPESRSVAVANLARHLQPTGCLIMGSGRTAGCGFDDVDGWCEQVGLSLTETFGTWDRQSYDGGDYRVSVHRWS